MHDEDTRFVPAHKDYLSALEADRRFRSVRPRKDWDAFLAECRDEVMAAPLAERPAAMADMTRRIAARLADLLRDGSARDDR